MTGLEMGLCIVIGLVALGIWIKVISEICIEWYIVAAGFAVIGVGEFLLWKAVESGESVFGALWSVVISVSFLIGAISIYLTCVIYLPCCLFAKFSKETLKYAILGLIAPLILGAIVGEISEKMSVIAGIFWFYVCHIVIWIVGSIIIISLKSDED